AHPAAAGEIGQGVDGGRGGAETRDQGGDGRRPDSGRAGKAQPGEAVVVAEHGHGPVTRRTGEFRRGALRLSESRPLQTWVRMLISLREPYVASQPWSISRSSPRRSR